MLIGLSYKSKLIILLKILVSFLPHVLSSPLKHWFRGLTSDGGVTRKILRDNGILLKRHAGQRCFILGNGPSAKNLNLTKLKNEWVFSISSGYFHHGYSTIVKKYHLLPQITYGNITELDIVKWFTEMDQNLGDATLFLNESEKKLVDKHQLFMGRTLHYVSLRGNFDELLSKEIIDITYSIPSVMSAPIMALMIAMYMGFKEIILIGVDHDELRTRQYKYAFETNVMHGKDSSVGVNGNVLLRNYDMFQIYATLWRQYRILSEIAVANNIEIINATIGGDLDEFPRREFDTLF